MTENTQNDALAAIIGRLGGLTESELRQLYQVIGIRLGFPDGAVPTGSTGGGNSTGRAGGQSSGKTKGNAKPGKTKAAGKTGGGAKPTSKGNPQRKSQWANHPLYQEYSRLKKVVENQSKEQKCSFSTVDSAESRAYTQALSQWLSAKSSFRGRKTTTNDEISESEREDDTEEEPGKPESSTAVEHRGKSKRPVPGKSRERSSSSKREGRVIVPAGATPKGNWETE